MAAVTAEVQAYAIGNINYEQIPLMIKQVSLYQQSAADSREAYENLPVNVRSLIDQFKTCLLYTSLGL